MGRIALTISVIIPLLASVILTLVVDPDTSSAFGITKDEKINYIISIFFVSITLITILFWQSEIENDYFDSIIKFFPISFLSLGVSFDVITSFIGIAELIGGATPKGIPELFFTFLITSLLFTVMVGGANAIYQDRLYGSYKLVSIAIIGICCAFDLATSIKGIFGLFYPDYEIFTFKSVFLVFSAFLIFTCQFILGKIFLKWDL